MVLNNYIKLKRGDKESIAKMMDACERALRRGCSVFLFPEGTRSKTGMMRPFKPGAFILAKKLGVPILPIAINGTRDALPKHSLNFHGKHHIEIRVLDEIPVSAFDHLSVEETGEMVRSRISEQVAAPAAGSN